MAETKAAIVTGAGSGIGAAVAARLAEVGYGVTLAGRTRSRLEDTAERITAAGADPSAVLVHTADAADPGQCADLVDATEHRFGRLDALVSCAGFADTQPITRTTPELWHRTVEGNLSAVVHLTREAWPAFERAGGGVVVNISSMASLDPLPGFAAYAAAKAGVNMFTRVTASEGEAIGLRAVCIAPGAVETGMLRALFDEKAIPPDRCLSPDEVAVLIRDCVTGRRAFDSGQTIPYHR